jgi:hypothetical protein
MTQPTPNAAIVANFLTWTVEQRFRYFVMGVFIPMLLVVGSSYVMLVSHNSRTCGAGVFVGQAGIARLETVHSANAE